jgi:membrane-associated phospholipid phosphatase
MAKTKHTAARSTAKVEKIDRRLARATGGQRNTRWMKMVGAISEAADQPPLIALSAATILAGVILGKRRLTRTGVRMLASHWLATQAKSLVKQQVDRTRPFVLLGGESYHARKGHSAAKRENSFPSGHTAGAVAVARAVARDYPASAPIGYGAAVTAGAVQLPRGAHFLSDVVAGAAIGLAAEAAIRLFLQPADAQGAVPGSADRVVADAGTVLEPADRGELVHVGSEAFDGVAGKHGNADPRGNDSDLSSPAKGWTATAFGDAAALG